MLQIVFVELLHLIDGIPEPLIDLRREFVNWYKVSAREKGVRVVEGEARTNSKVRLGLKEEKHERQCARKLP